MGHYYHTKECFYDQLSVSKSHGCHSLSDAILWDVLLSSDFCTKAITNALDIAGGPNFSYSRGNILVSNL